MNRRENVSIIEDGIEIASPYPLCSKVELGKHTIIIHGREFPDAESLDWLADAVKEKLARQPDPITGLVPCGCGGKATRSYSSIGCVVFCSTCGCTTKSVFFASEAVKVWNTAMGWKGGAK